MLGAPRCYAGPFGKSDRALGFGLLAALLGLGLASGTWTALYLGLILALSVLTICNRGRRILAEAQGRAA